MPSKNLEKNEGNLKNTRRGAEGEQKPSKSLSYDMVFINYDVVYKDNDVSCIFYDVV